MRQDDTSPDDSDLEVLPWKTQAPRSTLPH